MENYKNIKQLIILIILAVIIVSVVWFFRGSQQASNWLVEMTRQGKWILPVVVIAALIDSINPCAFSVLLITVAFLFSLGRQRKEIIKTGIFYIIGIYLVYIFIGIGLLKVFTVFNTPNLIAKIGAYILIVFGSVNLINEIYPEFPVKFKIPAFARKPIASLMQRATIPAVLVLGALVAITEFPCTGGPYLMILGLLHQRETFLQGLGYLVIYNLIFVSPLIVILMLSSNRALHEKVQAWQKEEQPWMKYSSGLAMVLLGALIMLFI